MFYITTLLLNIAILAYEQVEDPEDFTVGDLVYNLIFAISGPIFLTWTLINYARYVCDLSIHDIVIYKRSK